MELNIRVAGAAGQGIQTAVELLGLAVTRAGLFAQSLTDAESRIRGGLNFSQIRLADSPHPGVSDRIDLLLALSREGLTAYSGLVHETGLTVAARDWEDSPGPYLAELAREAGSEKTIGTVAAGLAGGLAGLDSSFLEGVLTERFGERSDLLEMNLRAAKSGLEAAQGLDPEGMRKIPAQPPAEPRMWLSGAQAVALGAVAGGVSFVAGYPMSPATGILINLSNWAAEASLVVEQAEDEVAAINMIAAASYTGARVMTATSGGGLCLMTEGISLLGMIEGPAVIALAQRPGPATGLPTRVAQGDLNLVRFAGHGSFARIILAPQDIPDCFRLTAEAFDLAERFQSPVFILTDQLLQDSQATIEPLDPAGLPEDRAYLTPAELDKMETYQRFAWAEDGLSPLAAPGDSKHVVVVDSDEHDQDGHLIEDAETAEMMARKRQIKEATIGRAIPELEVDGELPGNPLVITWGSTFRTVREALQGLNAAHLNLRWLWPLNGGALAELMAEASKVILIENSAGGELEKIIRELTLRPVDRLINRLDGRPFTVRELADRLAREVAR